MSTAIMKLADRENFEISLPYGAMTQGDDYPKGLDEAIPLSVISADINDPDRKVLTLRFKDGKAVNAEAKTDAAKGALLRVANAIRDNFLGKSLGEILDHDFLIAGRLN